MSKGIVCDNCGQVAQGGESEDWLQVGDRNQGIDDACSFKCARKILKRIKRVRIETDAVVAAENEAG